MAVTLEGEEAEKEKKDVRCNSLKTNCFMGVFIVVCKVYI
jgi:hypothetical protein